MDAYNDYTGFRTIRVTLTTNVLFDKSDAFKFGLNAGQFTERLKKECENLCAEFKAPKNSVVIDFKDTTDYVVPEVTQQPPAQPSVPAEPLF